MIKLPKTFIDKLLLLVLLIGSGNVPLFRFGNLIESSAIIIIFWITIVLICYYIFKVPIRISKKVIYIIVAYFILIIFESLFIGNIFLGNVINFIGITFFPFLIIGFINEDSIKYLPILMAGIIFSSFVFYIPSLILHFLGIDILELILHEDL